MTYAIKEIFYTLQGEGTQAGRAAVFVRFIGCNLWSGREADREADAARSGARCPMWCDTEFTPSAPLVGKRVPAEEVVSRVRIAAADNTGAPVRVVFTGGEPMLQLDAELLGLFRVKLPKYVLTVETNGTVKPKPGVLELLDVVCVSPKLPDADTVLRTGTELKMVVPDYQPAAYAKLADGFTHLFVQGQAMPTGGVVDASMQSAAALVMADPRLRLSVQVHKVIGLR